jgi:hypothetical protein
VQSFAIVGPLVLALTLVLAYALPRLVERYVPARYRESNLKSSLAVGGSIASPFMLVLGFMIVMLWTQMNDASTAVQKEADSLRNIDALVDQMDSTTSGKIRWDIVTYARSAVGEWDSLANGRSSPEATMAFRTLRDDVLALANSGGGGGTLVDHAITQILDAQSFRSERITAGQNDLPAVLWIALLVGTALYVSFIILTDTGPLASRVAITFIAVGVVGLSLLLIAMLDNPFRGDIQTSSAPLVYLEQSLSAPTH